MDSENSPKCLTCKHLCTVEIGYSEYTITGQSFKCLMGQYKDWEYNDEEKESYMSLFELAKKCPYYSEGTPEEHRIDCDIEFGNDCSCKYER